MDQGVRDTDYGTDTQDVESHAVSARFDPQTGERLSAERSSPPSCSAPPSSW